MTDRPAYAKLFEDAKGKNRSWPNVAVAAGVNERSIENYVKGYTKKPPLIPMIRIAAALDVDPAAFFAAVLSGEAPAQKSRVAELEERVLRLELLAGVERERDDTAPRDQADEAGSEPG